MLKYILGISAYYHDSAACIIKEGEARINPSGYQERIINYGDSICNCNFEIKHNGTVKPISIY